MLFFSCFVTFSILEVEGAGGGGRTKDTKKIYKEYIISINIYNKKHFKIYSRNSSSSFLPGNKNILLPHYIT